MEQNFDAPLNYKERIIKKGKVLRFKDPNNNQIQDHNCAYFRILDVDRETMVAKLLFIGGGNGGMFTSGSVMGWQESVNPTLLEYCPLTHNVTFTENDITHYYQTIPGVDSQPPYSSSAHIVVELNEIYDNLKDIFKNAIVKQSIGGLPLIIRGTSQAGESSGALAIQINGYSQPWGYLRYNQAALGVSELHDIPIRPLSIDDITSYFGDVEVNGDDIMRKMLCCDKGIRRNLYVPKPSPDLTSDSRHYCVMRPDLLSNTMYWTGNTPSGMWHPTAISFNKSEITWNNEEPTFKPFIDLTGGNGFKAWVIYMDLKKVSNWFDVDTRFIPLN